jgi:hypothetical protein
MLLSVTPKHPEPPPVYPQGLGLAYAALSCQAHKSGDLADLNAYLKQLGKTLLPATITPARKMLTLSFQG